jgi:uncharacterized protein YbaP (TraB family)
MRNTKSLVRWFALCLALVAGTAAAEDARTLLWEARTGAKTVYLFGTIHVGRADMYPLPKSVEDAWRASRTVALEAEIWNQDAVLSAMQIGVLPAGRSLERELPAELYAKLQRTLAANNVPPEAIRQLKPFMAMFTLVQLEYMKLGYVPEAGLDLHFAQRAVAEGKPLVGLETISGQMKMMDGLSAPLQQAMLTMTLEDIGAGSMAPMANRLVSSWRTGDALTVHEMLDSEASRLPAPLAEEFREKFLGRRNRAMLAGIEKTLAGSDTVFVAIGALHLIGPDSIIDLLARKGFAIRRR